MNWAAAGSGPQSRPTVLVTGATGFLGASLVSRLLSDCVRVRVLARSAMKAKPFADRGAQIVVGDIADPRAVRAAVAGAHVVYHLAGRLLLPGVPARVYRQTHVEGTKLILARCQQEPGLVRFIHCSTTGVLGITGDRPADENAPLRPTNMYEETKAEAELSVRDAVRAGFPAVIARPGLVYGPGDLHLLPFFRSVLARRFRPIGRRTVWLHPIYINDMIDGLLRCGDRAAAVSECFHLAGSSPVPLAGLAGAIAEAGGMRKPQGYIPMPAAQAVAIIGDRLPPSLKRSAPLTSSRLDFLTHSRVYDVSKARRLLDFTATTDLAAGIVQTMAWYAHHGYLLSRAAA
jgi:nucleoside-diphosphate-sugar epimerase